MSSPSKEDLLKSGHFPAKIAGGMRVAQREKKNSEKEVADESNTSYDEIDGNINDVDCKQTNNILASTGLAAKTKKDFPEEAIRAFHEKPHSKHEQPHENRNSNKIFQPRKN